MQTQTTTIAQLINAQIHCILFLLTSTSILYQSPYRAFTHKIKSIIFVPRAWDRRLFLRVNFYRYGKNVVSILMYVRKIG